MIILKDGGAHKEFYLSLYITRNNISACFLQLAKMDRKEIIRFLTQKNGFPCIGGIKTSVLVRNSFLKDC